jgi:thiosulfate reductase cytochrome b subunit
LLQKIREKHSVATRWLHWINFPLLTIMIWSGILIYWGNDVYKISWGDKTLLKFFPDSFNKALGIPYRLAEGMNLHFFFMWLFTINGVVYFLYLLFSKEYKLIFPHKKALSEAWYVLLHSLKIKKGLPPQKKYNAAQRIAYTGTIFLGFAIIITGLAIYKPVQLNWLCYILGGYEWARIEHFIITILFVLFFLVHIIQVILAGWNNFRAMVTGYEIVKDVKKTELPKNKEDE